MAMNRRVELRPRDGSPSGYARVPSDSEGNLQDFGCLWAPARVLAFERNAIVDAMDPDLGYALISVTPDGWNA